ncbi:MAG: helix-turn-helix domain-containing protein [Sphaerochaetaceae bacterium]
MKQVSASVLYNNVKFAAKQKQMKIGDIEEKAGVSPGYFSRLAGKDDRNSTIDALMNVADLLGVSFELLLTSDLEARHRQKGLCSTSSSALRLQLPRTIFHGKHSSMMICFLLNILKLMIMIRRNSAQYNARTEHMR